MGASIGIPAQGTVWEIESQTTPGSYIAIEGIKTYNINEGAPTTNDETTLSSTGYTEKSIGLIDPGTIALAGQYNLGDAGQAEIKTAKESGNLTKLRCTLADASVITWDVYVANVPWSGSANAGSIEGTINFELTGAPTYA